jgi:hypothetical protein
MLDLTITSPYVDFRVDYNTGTMGMGNPMTESTLTLYVFKMTVFRVHTANKRETKKSFLILKNEMTCTGVDKITNSDIKC